MRRIAFLATIAMILSGGLVAPRLVRAQRAKATGPSEFSVGGAVTPPLTISIADMKAMPRTTLRVVNPHNHKTETYQGVPLAALLEKSGVPRGEQIRGKWLAAYVLIKAADGYRVVYSLAELDSGFLNSDVLVADAMNGAVLPEGEGPFKLVAPRDKRSARWVRMVKSITVVRLPDEKR